MISEETRLKMKEAKRGRKTSEETKAKIRESMRGRKISEETKRKMGEGVRRSCAANKRVVSEETREKLREARRGKSLPGSGEAWNKGLTKETSEGVRKQAEQLSQAHKSGAAVSWSQGKTKSTDARLAKYGQKISDTINRKLEEGTWHNSFSKARIHEYKGHRLYGMWEVAFATHLDATGVSWSRPKKSFPYFFEGKNHRYTPDFYLEEEKVFIEIKGWATEKDLAKWEAFPNTLRVLFGEHLSKMGLLESFEPGQNFDVSLRKAGYIEGSSGWERTL